MNRHPAVPTAAHMAAHRLPFLACIAHLAKAATAGGGEVDSDGNGGGDDARGVGRRAEAARALRRARGGACQRGSSHMVRGSEREAREGAQFRAVPATAHLLKLAAVVVHLGAPGPHCRKGPAATGARRTVAAGLPD